jgi:putative ABC transport system permease protein
MLLWTTIKVAIKSLLANKLRSFLSMLGIIIGVGAVISMLALGHGAEKQIMDRITSMGANLLIIRAGQRGFRGVRSAQAETLKIEDARAILERVDGIDMVTPVVQGNGQFKYMDNNKRSNIIGAAVTYLPVRNYVVERGRAFTEGEVKRSARVAILGPATVEELFPGEDPLHKQVKINGVNYDVIGVLKAKGDQGWFNPDDQAIIPFTTVMKQILGVDYLREIDVQMSKDSNQEEVEAQIEALLRRRHRIRPEAESDFHIRNMAEFAETAQEVGTTMKLLLGSVAAMSLLVGGIGIMNIMLVTVTERTREIGIRKAIGAKNRDVLFQFLFEAVIMSGLGGLLGIAAGVGGAHAVARAFTMPSAVQVSSIILALSFSAAIGIFFGFYPARRAALLDPIDALSYE